VLDHGHFSQSDGVSAVFKTMERAAARFVARITFSRIRRAPSKGSNLDEKRLPKYDRIRRILQVDSLRAERLFAPRSGSDTADPEARRGSDRACGSAFLLQEP